MAIRTTVRSELPFRSPRRMVWSCSALSRHSDSWRPPRRSTPTVAGQRRDSTGFPHSGTCCRPSAHSGTDPADRIGSTVTRPVRKRREDRDPPVLIRIDRSIDRVVDNSLFR